MSEVTQNSKRLEESSFDSFSGSSPPAKSCTSCQELKSMSSFYYNKQHEYYEAACKECKKRQRRQRHKNTKSKSENLEVEQKASKKRPKRAVEPKKGKTEHVLSNKSEIDEFSNLEPVEKYEAVDNLNRLIEILIDEYKEMEGLDHVYIK